MESINQLHIQTMLISVLFCIALMALAFIDLKTMILPDSLTLTLIVLGILYNHYSSQPFSSLFSSIGGALLGFSLIWMINRIYFMATHKDGIGMGDAKLLATAGALMGIKSIIPTLIIASFLGIIGGLVWLKIHRLGNNNPFPFGPYLCLAEIILIVDSTLKIGIVQFLAL